MKIIIEKIIIENANEGSFDFKKFFDQFVESIKEKIFKVHDRIDLLQDAIRNDRKPNTKTENKAKKRIEKSATWKTKVYKCSCGEEFHKTMKSDVLCQKCRDAMKVKTNAIKNNSVVKDTHVPYREYQED
jgi:hypothetical protein